MTTPQKLAFVDVAKGIRMFARMAVPCAAVAENMAFFDGDDGKVCGDARSLDALATGFFPSGRGLRVLGF